MPADIHNSLNNRDFIIKEQVRLLYNSIPGSNFFSFVIVTILSWLISRDMGYKPVLPWSIVFIALLLTRYVLFVVYQKKNSDGFFTRWQAIYIIFCSSSLALMWGLTAFFYYPYVSHNVQITLLFTIVAICVGSIPILGIKFVSYSVYLLLAALPIFAQILLLGDNHQKLLVLLSSVFLFSSFIIGRRFNKTLTDSLHYRAESERLSDRLRTANSRLALANEDLERLSVTDDLTGIANRRYFNKRFAEIWADHVREKKTLTALMIDVDYFKDYNDHYGHMDGDKSLKRLAEAMHSVIYRPRDFLARYGGEEFIILLPDTNQKGAIQIADRLHNVVQDINIEHKPKGHEGRLTISIGIAESTPQSTSSKNKFLQVADEALYEAKNTGRNRTCIKTLKD